MEELRIHWWLPETTSYGERPLCENCKFYKTTCDSEHDNWICGSWVESEEQQLTLKTD